MEGIIHNFRRSRHATHETHMIIYVAENKNKDDAAKLVGKKVVWTSPAKKEICGTVAAAHGGKGGIRVIFETGMPGQSCGSKVTIQ